MIGFLIVWKIEDLMHCTQNRKRTILSLKKEPMLHILNNPLESQMLALAEGSARSGTTPLMKELT